MSHLAVNAFQKKAQCKSLGFFVCVELSPAKAFGSTLTLGV